MEPKQEPLRKGGGRVSESKCRNVSNGLRWRLPGRGLGSGGKGAENWPPKAAVFCHLFRGS